MSAGDIPLTGSGDVPESPEEAGIPDYADDDSTAYEDPGQPSLRDSPPSLPAESEQATAETGVTAAEQREGESLERHLAREQPDVSADDVPPADRRPEVAERGAEDAALHVEADERIEPGEDVPYEP